MVSNSIARLPRIPVELQCLILEQAISSDKHFGEDKDISDYYNPPEWPETCPSFPYNLAEVCILWRNLLKNKPECWTSLVFDVATDPWKYIGAFAWSKDLLFDVQVFNSKSSESQIDAQLERSRASRIMEALIPHMERCMGISFDLKFTTSLPIPMEFFCHQAPALERLLLNGQIDDLNAECDFIDDFLGDEDAHDKFFMTTGNMKIIALPGFWFLHLSTHPSTSEWIPLFLDDIFAVVINGFAFHEHGNFTVSSFMSSLWIVPAA